MTSPWCGRRAAPRSCATSADGRTLRGDGTRWRCIDAHEMSGTGLQCRVVCEVDLMLAVREVDVMREEEVRSEQHIGPGGRNVADPKASVTSLFLTDLHACNGHDPGLHVARPDAVHIAAWNGT